MDFLIENIIVVFDIGFFILTLPSQIKAEKDRRFKNYGQYGLYLYGIMDGQSFSKCRCICSNNVIYWIYCN